MNILWIEDGNLEITNVASTIFKGIVNGDFVVEEGRNIKESLQDQFAKMQEYPVHKLHICRNYSEWIYEKLDFLKDYDVILIDKDLSLPQRTIARKEPPQEYQNDQNFDKNAGLFIYNQLIRNGFPDANIAFLTANDADLNDFKKQCQSAYFDEPHITKGKSSTGYSEINQWLLQKADDPYLTLRRGIIDGCRLYKKEIEILTQKDLEYFLLFPKTINKYDIDYQLWLESYVEDLFLYLELLENYYPITYKVSYSFIAELASPWENALNGFFWENGKCKYENSNYQRNSLQSFYDFNFKDNANKIMKLLRNCVAHNMLSKEIEEKTVAFFFMLAMRALFNLDIEKYHNYEYMFQTIFKGILQKPSKEQISSLLTSSYQELFSRWQAGKEDDVYKYLDLLKEYGNLRINKNTSRVNFAKESIQFIYKSYFHGLFEYKTNDLVIQKNKLSFNFTKTVSKTILTYNPEFEKDNFPSYLAKLIYPLVK